MSKYVPARVAQEKLGVSLRTLLRWDEAGKIETIRTPNGQRRYNVESVLNPSPSEKSILLYARVSSHSQKPDLERQADFLLTRFPNGELVKEIASGLNFKRKKLRSLLERVLSGDVSMVVVCHKDRLARFGVELIQWLCERQGCQLVVLQQSDLSPEREMVEDLLAIIHVFSCRLYGLRKYKKPIREDLHPVSNGTNHGTTPSSEEVGETESESV